jgi:hypothetical protein
MTLPSERDDLETLELMERMTPIGEPGQLLEQPT